MYFTDYCEYSCEMSILNLKKDGITCNVLTELNPFRVPFSTFVPSLNVPYPLIDLLLHFYCGIRCFDFSKIL